MALAKDSTNQKLSRRALVAPRPIQVRRRTDYVVLTELNAASVGTGGTYSYGTTIDVSEYSEMILELLGSTIVVGSGAGLLARLEILSLRDQVYYPYPQTGTFAANPTSALTVGAGSTVLAAYQVPAPFGAMARVGFTCTTAFTSGSISAAMILKG